MKSRDASASKKGNLSYTAIYIYISAPSSSSAPLIYEVLLSDNASFNVVNFHHLEDLKSISASSGAQRERQLPSLKIVRRWLTKPMCVLS